MVLVDGGVTVRLRLPTVYVVVGVDSAVLLYLELYALFGTNEL